MRLRKGPTLSHRHQAAASSIERFAKSEVGASKMIRATRSSRRIRFALLALISFQLDLSPARAAEPVPCRGVVFDAQSYTVCEADLRRHAVRLFWRRPDGLPYAYLRALPRNLEKPDAALVFATNAGMFDLAYKPVGLYVENGKQMVPASTKAGYGNFHMRPNGIFFVVGDKAGILETKAYLKHAPHADVATQSGPMLVINGQLHPRFKQDSASAKRRNGVGVRDAHTVVFALSEGEVTFAAFARLFRDNLKCENALFLDGGSVPTFHIPSQKRSGNILPMGPMVGVFEKGAEERRQ
jgi:uncharacterized protein YigE (DUF2233 family)